MKSARKKSIEPPRQVKPEGYQRRKPSGWLSINLLLHREALGASLRRLLLAPFTSAMAIIVMAIALSLAGSFYVLVNNAQQLVDNLHTGKQFSLFLHERISDKQAANLAQRLQAYPGVANVVLISKQQALAEFQQYSGFGAALNALESNPLPAVIQVFPIQEITETYQLTQLLEQAKNEQEVDFAQIDMDWVARLQSIMRIANQVVMLLSSLLAVAVIFITGNTIRLELQTRRDEVVVEKLVGATNAFICLPFLYSGFWFGFIAGCFAWCIIAMMLFMVSSPIAHLSLLYQSQFQLHFMNLLESVGLIFGASALGVLGASAIVSHQLRLLKPE
ncbi:MAG: ABC transporter permease [Methyloprofundus sp.]|nr:ABC transporter permease [Methyloprofundus sp.]MBW6452787.1 permease-like cell division protein FtsX [Methyloprofundus sp.]